MALIHHKTPIISTRGGFPQEPWAGPVTYWPNSYGVMTGQVTAGLGEAYANNNMNSTQLYQAMDAAQVSRWQAAIPPQAIATFLPEAQYMPMALAGMGRMYLRYNNQTWTLKDVDVYVDGVFYESIQFEYPPSFNVTYWNMVLFQNGPVYVNSKVEAYCKTTWGGAYPNTHGILLIEAVV